MIVCCALRHLPVCRVRRWGVCVSAGSHSACTPMTAPIPVLCQDVQGIRPCRLSCRRLSRMCANSRSWMQRGRMNIALESKRARTRVDRLLGRVTPWLCGWGGRRGPRAACTSVTEEEWRLIQAKTWPGIAPCQRCAMASQQLRLL
jgi:hypothetical protein